MEERIKKLSKDLARKETVIQEQRAKLEQAKTSEANETDSKILYSEKIKNLQFEITRKDVLIRELKGRVDQLVTSKERDVDAATEVMRLTDRYDKHHSIGF